MLQTSPGEEESSAQPKERLLDSVCLPDDVCHNFGGLKADVVGGLNVLGSTIRVFSMCDVFNTFRVCFEAIRMGRPSA